MLYSYRGSRPTALPWSITLPSGFTRTDPTSFTRDEIQAAGFTGPYEEPSFDPVTQQLEWIEGEYVISELPLPLPQPQWQAFASALVATSAVNALVATAASQEPVLHLMLGVGLAQASQGDTATFRSAWQRALLAGMVSAKLADDVAALAQECNLPTDFLEVLSASSTLDPTRP